MVVRARARLRLRSICLHVSPVRQAVSEGPTILEHRDSLPGRPAKDFGEVEVAIIGGGLAAIVLAVKLLDAGITNFAIFEKGSDLGGTWHWNRYPGCACDVSSYAYLPYLQRLGTVPATKFVGSPAIRAHLLNIVETFGIRAHAVLGTKVLSADYSDDGGAAGPLWTLRTDRGDTCAARFLVNALGFLSTPRLPDVAGLSSFRGMWRHTSHWQDGDLEKCRGKTIAVVGTGSSAVQIAPELAGVAKRLLVIQRTPAWVDRRGDGPTDETTRHRLLNDVDAMGIRQELIDGNDLFNRKISSDSSNQRARAAITRIIRGTVRDPAVAAALTPDYPVGCKRQCVADTYYPMFNRENVTLVAGTGGVEEITETGFRLKDGSEHAVDVLVLATGFDAFTGAFRTFDVRGRGGRLLTDEWAGGPRCLYGMHAGPTFPNMVCLLGPQSPGIIINVTEVVHRQTDHLLEVLQHMRSKGCPRAEAVPESVKRYSDATNAVFPGSVFSQCNSWYNRPGSGADASHSSGQAQKPEEGGVEGWVGQFQDWRLQFTDGDIKYS